MEVFFLEEAIADNGVKWVTGEIAWAKSLLFPMWPVVVRHLKLMPDGETEASIDFMGGKSDTADCGLHNLNKYEALFPRLHHLNHSELYTDAVLDSIIAYRQAHELSPAAFYERCGIPEGKRKGFEDWLEENWNEDIERKWLALNKKTASGSSSSSQSSRTTEEKQQQPKKKAEIIDSSASEEEEEEDVRSSSNSSSVFASLDGTDTASSTSSSTNTKKRNRTTRRKT